MNKEQNDSNQLLHEVRLWARYFARMIDLCVLGIILGFFWELFVPFPFPESFFISEFIIVVTGIFFESLCLITFGKTFGKWLLKIRLRTIDDKKLPFSIALKRSFLVAFKGLAAGFPIIALFTLLYAYSDLKEKGITSWDKKYSLKVTHQKIGFIRGTIATLLFVGIRFINYLEPLLT